MADSILTTAVFSTAYMKPAAGGGEIIDALWGRKLADNTGYVYYRPIKIAAMGGIGVEAKGRWQTDEGFSNLSYTGTVLFQKLSGMNTLTGTARGGVSYTTTGSTAGTVTGKINGDTIFSFTNPSGGTTFATNFTKSISSLTDGNWYEITSYTSVGTLKGLAEGTAIIRVFDVWMSP